MPDPVRRIDGLIAAGITPALPPNPAPYLVEWMLEIGPTVPGGMGAAAFGWRDMAAWQALAGIELLPWEAQILRKLSLAFVNEASAAEKPDCPAPWSEPVDLAANREAVARKVGNAFKALALAGSPKQRRKAGDGTGRQRDPDARDGADRERRAPAEGHARDPARGQRHGSRRRQVD